jgi:hypothetical protein
MNFSCARVFRLKRAISCIAPIVFASVVFQSERVSALQVFYADNDLSTVSRQTLDGSGPQLLKNTQKALIGLAVDENAGKLYWSDNGQSFDVTARGMIYRSNLDGSAQETLYTAILPRNSESVGQLQLDADAQLIYWIDEEGKRIHRMGLNGAGELTVANVPTLGTALELDPTSGHLYFTTGSFGAGTAKIERMNVDGTNRVPIANAYGYSLELDPAHQNIYAADWFNNRLIRVGFDGTGLTQIAQVGPIRDMRVYGGHLYFPNIRSVAPDNSGPYFYQWVQSDLDGANRTVLYEVERALGPHDMIQFVVVPEPSAIILMLLSLTFLFRRRQARTPHHPH